MRSALVAWRGSMLLAQGPGWWHRWRGGRGPIRGRIGQRSADLLAALGLSPEQSARRFLVWIRCALAIAVEVGGRVNSNTPVAILDERPSRV